MMWKDSLFADLPLDTCVMNDKRFRDRYLEGFNEARSLPVTAADLSVTSHSGPGIDAHWLRKRESI
jgi:hypothetical protein